MSTDQNLEYLRHVYGAVLTETENRLAAKANLLKSEGYENEEEKHGFEAQMMGINAAIRLLQREYVNLMSNPHNTQFLEG